MTALEVYALCKKYTDTSVAGGGAIKGKNCTIQSIEPITGGNRVTFAWYIDGEDNPTTETMDVMDGVIPVIDAELSLLSENPVQNKVIASEINSIKSDITVEGSASGDIASFVDGSDNPLKELKISIEAVQSGTGDPSPTNVRPITGFNAVDITRCSKNLIYKKFANRTINSSGTMNYSGDFSLFIARIKKNAKYTLSINGTKQSSILVYGFYASDPVIGSTTLDNTRYLSGENPHTMEYDGYIAIRVNNADSDKVQLEYGEAATPYEPYNGNTYNINWQSTAGTVYGGTLNLTTGVLTAYGAYKIKKWSDFGNETQRANNFVSRNISVSDASTDASLQTANCICDIAPYALGDGGYTHCNIRVGNKYFYLYLPEDTSEDTDITFVYALATPVTYQLTPTEIRSLLGVNNVWADCGAITELKYTRDLNLCINDIISRIEALENPTPEPEPNRELTKSITFEQGDKSEGEIIEDENPEEKEPEEEEKEELEELKK